MKYLLTLLALALPAVVSAQAALGGFMSIVFAMGNIISALVPLMISLAFVVFAWGIIRYVLAKDPEAQKEAKGTIVWGIIAITAIVGVWAIAYFLLGQVGVNQGDVVDIVIPGIQQ